jgi:hypothetical protein
MFTVITARKALQDLLADHRVSWKDEDHFKQLAVAAEIASVGDPEIAAGAVAVDEHGTIIVEDIEGRTWRLTGRHMDLLETAEEALRLLKLAERDLAQVRDRKAARAAAVFVESTVDDLEKGIANNQYAARRDLRETLLASFSPPLTWGEFQQTREVLALLLECLSTGEDDEKLLSLLAERQRLEARALADSQTTMGEEAYDALVHEIGLEIGGLDDQIADFVARTGAGIVGQVGVLLKLHSSAFGADDTDHPPGCFDRLAASIIASVRRLGGAA